ncbi:MAG TPA: hypothetical protein VG672_03235 [Bryobacteraceae bacterium]|jgi:hypothetical protein|nr:hypothetical protein [Bryobacteraceae bacterium]
MHYESTVTVQAKSAPGVTLRIRRMSFGRRLELMRRIRELTRRAAALEETADEAEEKMEAALLAFEMDRIYLTWGVEEIRGLEVDGMAATAESLAEAGPEPLFREALALVKGACGLGGGQHG